MIPFCDPRANYLKRRAEIDEAVLRVLAAGRYIHGPECEALESEFAAWNGTKHAVGVANGTDAVRIALAAVGIKPGDEVITVSHTAVATVAAVELAGAAPVLADIEERGFTLDPTSVEAAITPRTRAVVAVHLYGNPASLEKLAALCRKRGLRLVEDCAQAHGARVDGRMVGTWGDVGAFSFYPTKNLGALGDGGMIVTADPGLAAQCRKLREYGWVQRFISEEPGMNSRLDEVQAAILRVKLKYLHEDNAARQAVARRYVDGLQGLALDLPAARAGAEHVFHLFVVRTAQRDALRSHLKGAGIDTGVHFAVPVHAQPAYRGRVRTQGALERTERAAREILSLPIYPEIPHADVDRTIAAIRSFFARAT